MPPPPPQQQPQIQHTRTLSAGVYKPSLHTRNNHSTASQTAIRQMPMMVPPPHPPNDINDSDPPQQSPAPSPQQQFIPTFKRVDSHHQQSEHNQMIATTGTAAAESEEDASFPREICAGRYRLVRRIGEGSFGVIFMAVDRQQNNAKVAVKFVPQTLTITLQSTITVICRSIGGAQLRN